TNTIVFSSEEKPNFDGVTYSEDLWPGIHLRSQYAPVIDNISITQFSSRTRPGRPWCLAVDLKRATGRPLTSRDRPGCPPGRLIEPSNRFGRECGVTRGDERR